MKDFLIQLNNSQLVSQTDLKSFFADYFEAKKTDKIKGFEFKESFLLQNKSTNEVKVAFIAANNDGMGVMLNQDFEIISEKFRTYNTFSDDMSLRDALNAVKKPEDNYINGSGAVINYYFLNSLYDPSAFREPFIRFLAENSYGLIDLNGKYIIKPYYYTILPFSLKSKDFVPRISLLVCGKEHGDDLVDVYDINGNLIFSQIKQIKPKSETINYKDGAKFFVEDNIAFERELTQLEVIAEDDCGDDYSCIIPVKALYNEPSGEYPLHLHAIDDRCDWETITSSVNLNRIKEVIIPMAKTIAEKQNQPLNRIIASIPIWNTLNEADKPLENVRLSTPMLQLPIDSHTKILLRRCKISTVQDLLETDFSQLDIPRFFIQEESFKNIILLKMRLIKTFEQQ